MTSEGLIEAAIMCTRAYPGRLADNTRRSVRTTSCAVPGRSATASRPVLRDVTGGPRPALHDPSRGLPWWNRAGGFPADLARIDQRNLVRGHQRHLPLRSGTCPDPAASALLIVGPDAEGRFIAVSRAEPRAPQSSRPGEAGTGELVGRR